MTQSRNGSCSVAKEAEETQSSARGTRRVSQRCEKKRYKRKNVSRRFVSRLEEPKEDRSEKETNADDKEEQIDEEPPSKVVEKEDGEESTVEVGVVHEESEEAIVATATRSEESATEVATNDGENVESRGVEEVPMATAPLVTESESLVNEEEEPATVLRDDETVAIATGGARSTTIGASRRARPFIPSAGATSAEESCKHPEAMRRTRIEIDPPL